MNREDVPAWPGTFFQNTHIPLPLTCISRGGEIGQFYVDGLSSGEPQQRMMALQLSRLFSFLESSPEPWPLASEQIPGSVPFSFSQKQGLPV